MFELVSYSRAIHNSLFHSYTASYPPTDLPHSKTFLSIFLYRKGAIDPKIYPRPFIMRRSFECNILNAGWPRGLHSL